MSRLNAYQPIVRVRNDLPWRFRVALYREGGENDGQPFAFPDGWTPGAQIRIETTEEVIDLGAPVTVLPLLGQAVFETDPEGYAAVPLGQQSKFSWWLANGSAQETYGIYPLQVIER